MKVGDYLVCKKEKILFTSIILVGKKYKIISIEKVSDGLESLYSISGDFISETKSIIDGEYDKSFIKYFSSFKNSFFTNLHIYDYFMEISEVREEKLKELGI